MATTEVMTSVLHFHPDDAHAGEPICPAEEPRDGSTERFRPGQGPHHAIRHGAIAGSGSSVFEYNRDCNRGQNLLSICTQPHFHRMWFLFPSSHSQRPCLLVLTVQLLKMQGAQVSRPDIHGHPLPRTELICCPVS